MNNRYLGIDMGTSSMKLVLIDEAQRVLAQATEHYTFDAYPDGGCEMDPGRWYQALVQGVHRVLCDAGCSAVRAISLTGQMHSLTVLDGAGAALRPSILWNDLRTGGEIDSLKKALRSFPEGDEIAAIVSTGSPAASLHWLRDHEPSCYARIGHFLIGSSYLVFRLTGRYAIDYCNASTSGLYESRARRWSPGILAFLGLCESACPEVLGSCEIAGMLTEAARLDLGLSAPAAVLVGTGDNAAAAFAAGMVPSAQRAGRSMLLSLGTSGVLTAAAQPSWAVSGCTGPGKRFLFSPDGLQYTVLVQGVEQSCGKTLSWWMNDILGESDLLSIDRTIRPEDHTDCSALFFPHLNGDKTLYADPNLRGAFIGLSLNTRKEDMLYAVLEGLCFGIRELYETMQPDADPLLVIGGGTKSEVWMQILANVLEHPVGCSPLPCDAAFGAALLAADAAPASGREPLRVFHPNSDLYPFCRKRYKMYRRFYQGLTAITDT